MSSFDNKTLTEKLYQENGLKDFDNVPVINAQEDDNVEPTPKENKGRIFRFLFLIADIVFLNLIPIILLSLMNRVHYSFAYFILFIATNVFWVSCAYITALYFSADGFVKRSALACALYFSSLLLFIFLFNYDYSRLFILLSFSCFTVSLLVTRTLFVGTNYFLKSGKALKKVVVLGISNVSEKLLANLGRKHEDFEIVGYFDERQSNKLSLARHNYLGDVSNSVQYALENGINEIYSTVMPQDNPLVYTLALEAEKSFIRFRFVPDFSFFVNRQMHVNFLYDTPIFSLRPEPLQEVRNQMKKRIFDVIFSSIVIVLVLSWLVPIIGLLIKLNSRGPIFFKQLRSGKNNRKFLCYKFRSLHVNKDADDLQVVRTNSRFTRVGRILRKTNIDELPQFFNVFEGDISVVGPRPHMLKHTEQYSSVLNRYMVRHFIKPGITGLAQINGFRGEIKRKEQLNKRVEYDIFYMENWSMWLDFKIILLTLYVTFKGDKNAF